MFHLRDYLVLRLCSEPVVKLSMNGRWVNPNVRISPRKQTLGLCKHIPEGSVSANPHFGQSPGESALGVD